VINSPQKVAAAEGVNARFQADLKASNPNSIGLPPGTYFLYVKHQQPRVGTGPFTVAVRKE